MNEPTPTVATCCACGTTRDLHDLLRCSETGGLHRSKFVCRPSVDGRCFRGMVGRRDLETITTALPEEPLLPHYGYMARSDHYPAFTGGEGAGRIFGRIAPLADCCPRLSQCREWVKRGTAVRRP